MSAKAQFKSTLSRHLTLNAQLFKIQILFIFLLSGFSSNATDPVVKVRFANPEYLCTTQTYSLDVEFQCNVENQQLSGMNVRFFYSDNILEFISFGEFHAGYETLGSPDITTGTPVSGMALFGFSGPHEYINASIHKNSETPITYISTAEWTKLFNVSFHIDDPEAVNTDNFCPSVIWDMEEDPANGGIPPGSSGVVITLVTTYPNSTTSTENVLQFNWQYDGIPGIPHGYPVNSDCINTICAWAPGTYLPVFGYSTPGQVNVPVTVTNFINVGSFALEFEYDPAIMTYTGNTPNAVFSTENGLLTVTDSVSTGGKNIISMNFQANNPVSLSDNSHLADISFTYLSGSTDLTWVSDGDACQYTEYINTPSYDQPYSDYYMNGMAVSTLAPITKIDSIVAVEGEYVTFAVRIWDYTNIHSGFLTLDYDPDALVFQGAIPNVAISDYFETRVISPGTLELEWVGNDTSLADGNILVNLIYYYQGGNASLTWLDNGLSCLYISSILMQPLTDIPSDNYFINGHIDSDISTWTGGNSNDWYAASNWANNVVPDQNINIIIEPSEDPLNWPVFNGDFSVGEDCKNLTLNGNARLTINGDFNINPGHTLDLQGSGILQVSGNWTNSGIFNPGTGVIEFTGTDDGTIGEGLPAGNDISAYILSTFTTGMAPITGGTAGPAGKNAHADVNIGFDFNYPGGNYTQVRINTNGWLSLNLTGDDATSSDNNLLFNTSAPSTALAPWWDDLIADSSTFITYVTEGSAPYRVFISEWKNILAFSSVSTTRLNFQVKLYESIDVIEFCYGDVTGGIHHADEGASIGIKDTAGGPGSFLEATQNSSAFIIAFLKSNSEWPVVNYRFSPPTENEFELFHKIIVSKTTGKLHINHDVLITGLD